MQKCFVYTVDTGFVDFVDYFSFFFGYFIC